jgi:hypothetical protein
MNSLGCLLIQCREEARLENEESGECLEITYLMTEIYMHVDDRCFPYKVILYFFFNCDLPALMAARRRPQTTYSSRAGRKNHHHHHLPRTLSLAFREKKEIEFPNILARWVWVNELLMMTLS